MTSTRPKLLPRPARALERIGQKMPPAEDSRTNASKMKMPHVLRPHHVSLLMIMMCVFKEMHRKLPAAFLLHVYRILLREVSEVFSCGPTRLPSLLTLISKGLTTYAVRRAYAGTRVRANGGRRCATDDDERPQGPGAR